MIESPTLSWILTVLFAATGLWFLMRCVRSVAGAPVPGTTGRISCATCAVMSVAMISMSWSWGMRLPVWPQVAVFALATLWFAVLATYSRRSSRSRRPRSSRLSHVHNALMMAAVVWMLATMPSTMIMADTMGHNATSVMGGGVISAVLAAYFLFAALPWLTHAVRTHRSRHVHHFDAISHAAMSVGMGAMLLVMT